jgi:enoyl-CoA hydratase
VYEHLSVERRDEVLVVRINRPPANAIDLRLLEEGHAALEELRADPPGAIVLTGSDGFFSAGVDLKVAPTLDRRQQGQMVAGINRIFAGWYGFPRPVVCAVNGHAIAGGLILALCADYRVGATEGRLGLTELRAGFPYPTVAKAVAQAELGPAAARILMLRAQLVEPQEALALGLVDELVEPDRVLSRALEVAEQMAGLPRSTYEQVKRQLRGETIELAERVVAEGSDPFEQGWAGPETPDAAAAILARAPDP